MSHEYFPGIGKIPFEGLFPFGSLEEITKELNLDMHAECTVDKILADEKEKLLFTGDAIGSGNYCWMWMPGCLTLTEYRKTLAHLKEVLAPYRDYTMLGGHRRQGMEEENPDSHPLTMQVIEDMDTLTERILNKETSPVGTERNFGFLTYVYRFGHAGIVLRKNKIK